MTWSRAGSVAVVATGGLLGFSYLIEAITSALR